MTDPSQKGEASLVSNTSLIPNPDPDDLSPEYSDTKGLVQTASTPSEHRPPRISEDFAGDFKGGPLQTS